MWRYRKWLWGAACAVLALVVVGFSVRAPVKDWWLSREACGGELPGEDLRTVRPEGRLGEERESFDESGGRYHCVLVTDQDKVVVAVDAYLDGADREDKLSYVGESYPPQAVLPGGLPGFESQNSLVYLMPECPGRGKGRDGDPRRLLVGTWTYFAESREEKAAMLRLAVRMTNVVTEKLGCGGKPLPPPEDGAVPDPGRYVPRAKTQGTACAAFATARVPAEGRDGQVRIAVAEGGMVGRCTLYAAAESDGDRRRPLVELTSWRGDWGVDVREMGSGPDPMPMGDGPWKPALTEDRAWAVARCDGERTGFAAHWGDDYPYREEGEQHGPPTEAERKERRERLRAYVTAFAQDQTRLGGCTELRVPAAP